MEVYFEHVLLRILGTFVLGTMFEKHLSETLWDKFGKQDFHNLISKFQYLGCKEIFDKWMGKNKIK
jgi:hypothetical protein